MAKAAFSIAIEGVIGVGKTTLARAVAERLGAFRLCEEDIVNPFLTDFYKNRSRWALACQLSFLHGRMAQFRRPRPVGVPVVSDHSLVKEPLFAAVNIANVDELDLYTRTYAAVADPQAFHPQVVVYLTAQLDEVRDRIRQRGRRSEYKIDVGYLADLVDAYEAWCESDAAGRERVVVVSADGAGIAEDPAAVDRLIDACRRAPVGLSYCNPIA